MTSYPLLFRAKDWIQGPGFAAGVRIEGRVLMRLEEDGQWWAYGVTPGGLSESDSDPIKAYEKFRQFFRGILTDMAEEAGSFAAFKAKVAKFVTETDDVDAAAWTAARETLKKGALNPEGMFANLQKVTDPTPGRLVECVDLTPGAPAHELAVHSTGEDQLLQAA